MNNSSTLTIKIPGSVYYDALDPACSGMAAEIGIERSAMLRRGKGWQAVYENVSLEQATEIADYIGSRAETLLGDTEAEDRGPLYAAIKTATRIQTQVRAEQ